MTKSEDYINLLAQRITSLIMSDETIQEYVNRICELEGVDYVFDEQDEPEKEARYYQLTTEIEFKATALAMSTWRYFNGRR